MGVLTYDESDDLILDTIQANVTTNPPFTAAQVLRAYNEAYNDVWEAEGGGITQVTGLGTTWTPSPTFATDGKLVGVLRDINEIISVGATLSSIGLVGDATTIDLTRVERGRIQWLRDNTGLGTYAVPKLYSVTRIRASSDVAANVGRYDLDVWPGVGLYYFPMDYVRQFVPLAGNATDVPDVTDIGSRDICWLAAMNLAPLQNREQFVPGLLMRISEKTRLSLERKRTSLLSPKVDV